MKICFMMYQGNMYSGGQGVYLHYLTRELVRLGHQVHVIAAPPVPQLDPSVHLHPLDTSSFWAYLDDYPNFLRRKKLSIFHPVNLFEFATTRLTLSQLLNMFSLRAYVKLNELERTYGKFDIIHDNQTLAYGMLLMQRRTPLVVTIHHPMTIDLQNSLHQARGVREKVRRLLWFPWVMQAVVAGRADARITVSETAARSIEAAFKIPRERLHVIHNGVDTEVFRPLPGTTRDPHHILYVGNSEDRNKGARFLLEALALLRDEVPFHLTLVDRRREELKLAPALVRRHGLSTRVTFTGRVSTAQLVALYNRAGLVVSPSVYEGFGLPAAEAMACGAPLVATTGGAFPEIVEHNRTGWLVPPADPAALAAAIRLLLGDAALRARLGEAAAARIRERFDWRRAARQTEAVYQEVLG
ncbi:MAG TPA: glycosyltransferase family 4 protein, partial [Dehalococcoidia bacterium]